MSEIALKKPTFNTREAVGWGVAGVLLAITLWQVSGPRVTPVPGRPNFVLVEHWGGRSEICAMGGCRQVWPHVETEE